MEALVTIAHNRNSGANYRASTSILQNSTFSNWIPIFQLSIRSSICIKEMEASPQFFYDSLIQSDLEAKLRDLLFKLANDNKILGIQVCTYKDGQVVIDTAAGILGKDDPRPVQHDSLFPVFSVTKGITAGMVHWLVDHGNLKFDDNVANIWPGFGIHKKDLIKVHHVLNHTSGLHNAMSDAFSTPSLVSNWKECLDATAASIPESEPGSQQLYHYSSFGWLCGGIIEHASGKKFQEILDEAVIQPNNIEGELYIGIPPGVESRLASLTPDMEEVNLIMNITRPDLPSSFQPAVIAKSVPIFADLFNTLEVRRSIIPAANGHCSARALARYYATLATGGIVPPPYLHANKVAEFNDTSKIEDGEYKDNRPKKIFSDPKIRDAFMGVCDYANLVLPNGGYGLGFRRYGSGEGLTAFGHSGMGGSIGFCDVEHNFSIAVTVNKMSLGTVTGRVVQLICSELNVPVPQDYKVYGEQGPYIKVN